METQGTQKNLPTLVKRQSTYKMFIPNSVERQIRFLCERVWNTEWSGVLFYNYTGNLEDGSLEIHCVDILPMDIGSATYTEFNMSPDVISYMAQNPKLLDCKMGLIHSHNNMSTFFSGTDLNTLQEEGAERNHFVSLIVNNEGKYTAAITRKVTYNAKRIISYESFDSVVTVPEEEVFSGEEIEYFPLEITIDYSLEDAFVKLADRLKEIKDSKPAKPATTYNTTAYVPSLKPYSWGESYTDPLKKSEPTLFDNVPSWTSTDTKDFDKFPKEEKKDDTPDSPEIVEGIVNQLITGSVTLTKLDKGTKERLLNSMDERFIKRFKDGEDGMLNFEIWAEEFIEYLLWYSIDNPDLDDYESTIELAANVVKALENLNSKSKYIEKYIEIISAYGTKLM